MIKCPHCGNETRMMGQVTISAPSSLSYKLSKTNLRSKDVYLTSANWETFDYICEQHGLVHDAYGNYVSNKVKRVELLEAILNKHNIPLPV